MLWYVFINDKTHVHFNVERWNKKCKNLTSNKNLPFQSLANSLVRDATARFFRWRRGETPTRHSKAPKTEVDGVAKVIDVPAQRIQLPCVCRVQQSTIYSHSTAVIGGKRFNAGNSLSPGQRCGSVITTVRGGRSVYGLVKKFVRVLCRCLVFHDFALVTWFPLPVYPDGDPLTVRVDLGGIDINNIAAIDVISLNDIQPSRIAVDIDRGSDCMYMMRMDGLDIVR